ncbi:MAG: hypothetical protein M0R74_04445 [Dehalococcoidia bacterium]|nr:hypothetical protein [Dehalococcoidia bacterium]
MSVSAPERRGVAATLLSPRALVPVIAVLALALVGMGVAYAMKDDGQVLSLASCEPGTAGCELRQTLHDHADFAVFIDGEQVDFGKPEYISTADRELSLAAHIHPARYSVVHVHYSNTTWDEFFRSLGFELRDSTVPGGSPLRTSLKLPDGTLLQTADGKSFKFYVNGVRVDGVASAVIGDLDRVLISYGGETPEEVEQLQLPLLSDEACIPSERCHDRIPDGEPPEPCSRSAGTCG